MTSPERSRLASRSGILKSVSFDDLQREHADARGTTSTDQSEPSELSADRLNSFDGLGSDSTMPSEGNAKKAAKGQASPSF